MRTLEHLLNLIKYSPIAEKTVKLKKLGICTFVVDRSMTKPEIKQAISSLLNNKIVSINTCKMPVKKKQIGKFTGKKAQFKKAYIKLANLTESFDFQI